MFMTLETASYSVVEMKVSPLRALTQDVLVIVITCKHGRNESKPVEGIDTFLRQFHSNGFCKTYRVE